MRYRTLTITTRDNGVLCLTLKQHDKRNALSARICDASEAVTMGLAAESVDFSKKEEITALADIWEGNEAKQGIDAFFKKETPPWARNK